MLREFLVIRDVGIGLDDVGEGGAGGLEASLDVFATCWIWARISPLPTQLPSRAICPATKIILRAPDRNDLGVGRLAGPDHDVDAVRLNLFTLDRHLFFSHRFLVDRHAGTGVLPLEDLR
jgi:hypothetical protein